MPEIIPSSTVLNNALRTVHGKKIGTVEEIFVDPEFDQAVCVVVSLSSEANLASQYRPVPCNLFHYEPGNGYLVFEDDEQKVRTAPYIEESQLSSPPDREAFVNIYRHYGIKPYWEP